MYRLTLTRDERRAINWVGNRYTNGDELYTTLQDCETKPEDVDWDYDRDITFYIPEHTAWQISNAADQEDSRWPCFAIALADKMDDLCSQLV